MLPSESAEAILQKKHKAIIYATEPERFEITCIQVTMNSKHGVRKIGFDGNAWSCTCEFFANYATCSHTIAIRMILSDAARLKIGAADIHAE